VATWGQVTLLLHTMYDVLEDSTDSLDVEVPTGAGRTQVVTVRHVDEVDGGGPWVVLESPVAHLDDVDVNRALELSEDLLVGGLGKRMEFLTVTHAAPLSTLDGQDLARPLRVLAHSADRLERALVGQDNL
jgi:hypothetical protein